MFICQYCDKECKNKNSHINHERLCPKNKNRNYVSHTVGLTAWNKGLTGDSRCSKKGTKGRPHTEQTKIRLSKIAKDRGFGGYRENAGRSKKYKVIDSFGKETTLQSSYELKCSELLNELKIKWLRPKALKYNGKKYFADFYLPDLDIYLDPKNSHKAKLDKEKIETVKQQNNVNVYILLEEHLTLDFLKSLCS